MQNNLNAVENTNAPTHDHSTTDLDLAAFLHYCKWEIVDVQREGNGRLKRLYFRAEGGADVKKIVSLFDSVTDGIVPRDLYTARGTVIKIMNRLCP